MTAWEVTHEQWEDWASAIVVRTELDGELDAVDAQVRLRLKTHMFPTGDDETLVREAPDGLEPVMEEMETVVRAAPTAPDAVIDEQRTVVRRAPTDDGLSVALDSPDGSELSVELQTPPLELDDDEGDGEDDMFIPTLTRSTLVPTQVPAHAAPFEPDPVEADLVEEVAAEMIDDDVVEAPAPVPMRGDGASAGVIGPPPPSAVDEEGAATGVIGVPPDPDPGSSQTSGVIQAVVEPRSGDTLIGGEAPDPVVPKRSKIVVDPSASGVFAQVEEPEELDESDFVEEEPEVIEPEPEPEPAPPPMAPPVQVAPAVAPPAPPPAAVEPPPARTGATLPPPPAESVWLEAAFGEHSFALLSHNRPHQVAREVDFIVASVRLPGGARVLDIGCGDGSHTLAFAARGMSVMGLDASPHQLGRARATAQQLGAAITYVQGDMRELPVPPSDKFDLVTCVGSTLGFFDDATNEGCVVDMAARVAPGGHLVLHVFNRDRMVGRLPARSWWQGQGCLVLDEARFDSRTSRMHVHRTMVFEDGRQFDVNIEQRAYGAFELEKMVAAAGLTVVEVSGSVHTRGTIYGAMSPDIWLVARAPG